MLRAMVGGSMLMVMGCAPVPPQAEAEVLIHGDSGHQCDASKAQSLIGVRGTEAVAASAQQLSGARAVRWLQPGQQVTMDYRVDRLNIELDAQGMVVGIRCG